jgi:hypothetical protein
MIGRPYRSGATQGCLLCRQSDEIREKVLKKAKNHTTKEIVEWLKTVGIVASIQQVRYYLRKKGATPTRAVIKPKGSYAEKVQTYIDELLKCEGKTYTLWSLNLRGSSWTVVTRTLNSDGLIESIGGNPRTRWKILASKDKLRSWRDAELRRMTEHR